MPTPRRPLPPSTPHLVLVAVNDLERRSVLDVVTAVNAANDKMQAVLTMLLAAKGMGDRARFIAMTSEGVQFELLDAPAGAANGAGVAPGAPAAHIEETPEAPS